MLRPGRRRSTALGRTGLGLAVLALAVAVLVGCSPTLVEVVPATSQTAVTEAEVPLGNPGTLVPPTDPGGGEPRLLAIEPLMAFMDACVARADLVGPCHCAADRIERSFASLDIEVLEDRMSGALEFPPDLAGTLVGCRDAAPPRPWTDAERQRYLHACSAGSQRLASLCACSLARAEQVIPAHRLEDFLASNEARPDTVDFINLCL